MPRPRPTQSPTEGRAHARSPDARTPRIAYIIPTHNRPDVLDTTLRRIAALPPHDAEIIIADNASDQPVSTLLREGLGGVTNGELPFSTQSASLPVHLVRADSNLGAAGRNFAVETSDPSCEWVVMLDDDSWPEAGSLEPAARNSTAPDRREHPDAGASRFGLLDSLAHWHPNTHIAAIAGEISLPDGRREAGGLPEVFIGCGCAIRRDAFLALRGYDPAFNYYAEEYDLAARLIAAGLHTVTDRRARFTHAKVSAGRNMNLILARLVRNNGWVMQRYAPPHLRTAQVRHIVDRYQRIARKEHAESGWNNGYAELLRTLRAQPRTPLAPRQWDRFTGKAAARRGLLSAWAAQPFSTARIVREGKGSEIVRNVLEEMGVQVLPADRPQDADATVIGTLSPGPMWDAVDAERAERPDASIIAPWQADADASTANVQVRRSTSGRAGLAA